MTTLKQYESGRRIPKDNQLSTIAKVLGVPIEYLTDHTIDSYNDVKHTLFELEETFGLKILEINHNYVFSFNDIELNDFIKEWYNKKESSKHSSETLRGYEQWKISYPNDNLDRIADKLKKKRDELSREKTK